MTQPRVEHLTVKSATAAGGAASTGFWPPLPPSLWLPPAVGLAVLSAGLLTLCLSGTQSPQLGVGWLEPREAPLLLTWLTAVCAVFFAPLLSRHTQTADAATPELPAPPPRTGPSLLQALAVALPLAGVAWAFHAVALLLDTDAASRLAGPDLGGITGLLPAGLPAALATGAVAGLVWLWLSRWPRATVVVLAGWAALPPLAWFLSVDVMGRDPGSFPAWLTVNPVYSLVLLDRNPRALPGWSIPVVLTLLALVPLIAAGLARWKPRQARPTQTAG